MSRSTAATATATTILLVALSGCGIPDETDVRVDGQVSATLAYGSPGAPGAPPPARLASGDDARAFAKNLLFAAAGETDRSYDRFRAYVAPSERDLVKEKQGVTVVRLRDGDPYVEPKENDTYKVTIPVQQVGVLKSDGSLAPPVSTVTSYTFTVGKAPASAGNGEANADAGLYVLENPPPTPLLDVEALRDYYQPQTIYFWNNDRSALVPDLRYLPVEVPQQRKATDVLDWLIKGPSDWLGPAAVSLPDGTEQDGTVPQNGDRLEVNLAALPGSDERAELDRLAMQLVWSLPDLRGELELKIRNQSRMVIEAETYRSSHQVYPLISNPEPFCVYGGSVRQLVETPEQAGPAPLAPEVNHDVVSAALGRSAGGVLVALVTAASDGRRVLQVGTGPAPVDALRRGTKTFGSMGRPVWLKTSLQSAAVGLVVADGRLYRFSATDPNLRRVSLPGAVGTVSSMDVSPDGNRIALVSGRSLYVAALSIDSGDNAADLEVAANPARLLPISLQDLVAVSWSSEWQLVVAGTHNERSAIYEVGLDGAREDQMVPDTGATVAYLAAYPNNTQPTDYPRVMYEANKYSWVVNYPSPKKIERNQVAGAPAAPPAGGTTNPTAPFFYY